MRACAGARYCCDSLINIKTYYIRVYIKYWAVQFNSFLVEIHMRFAAVYAVYTLSVVYLLILILLVFVFLFFLIDS